MEILTRLGCDFFGRVEPKARLVTRSVSEAELTTAFTSLTRRVTNKVTASLRRRGQHLAHENPSLTQRAVKRELICVVYAAARGRKVRVRLFLFSARVSRNHFK